jgi:hypothetical protein
LGTSIAAVNAEPPNARRSALTIRWSAIPSEATTRRAASISTRWR